MTTEQRSRTIFDSTIQLQSLSFGDWQAIAESLEKPASWAYFKWVDVSKPDLSVLTMETWEEIRDVCEFKEGWAYWQWKNNRG